MPPPWARPWKAGWHAGPCRRGRGSGGRGPKPSPRRGRHVAPGDWMRIEVGLNRPAYCYVVWIDTEGRATPLYPWLEEDWSKRPREQARDRFALPEGDLSVAPLGPGPAGMETLLLLARAEP